jgi:hypothetical protein
MDDIEQIRRLKARYFRLVDTKDWDGLADVFTADVVVDMRSEGGGVTSTREDFLAYLRANIEHVTTVHHGHMPEITLEDTADASGIWAMEDMLWWPDGAPLRRMHGYGHYHETYRRGPDGWQIAALRLTRLHRELELAPVADA